MAGPDKITTGEILVKNIYFQQHTTIKIDHEVCQHQLTKRGM